MSIYHKKTYTNVPIKDLRKVESILAEVTAREGRVKAGVEANAAEELTTLCGCIQPSKMIIKRKPSETTILYR